jgi:hypothetical protein
MRWDPVNRRDPTGRQSGPCFETNEAALLALSPSDREIVRDATERGCGTGADASLPLIAVALGAGVTGGAVVGFWESAWLWLLSGGAYPAGCFAAGVLSEDPSFSCPESSADELGRSTRAALTPSSPIVDVVAADSRPIVDAAARKPGLDDVVRAADLVPSLLSRVDDAAAEIAAFRQSTAMVPGEGTVAHISGGGVSRMGINGGIRPDADRQALQALTRELRQQRLGPEAAGVNLRHLGDAEGDALWNFALAHGGDLSGVDDALLVVDRALCPGCRNTAGLQRFMEVLGLRRLRVVAPDLPAEGRIVTPTGWE